MEIDNGEKEDIVAVLQFLVDFWDNSENDHQTLIAFGAARRLSERFCESDGGETSEQSLKSLRERIKSIAATWERMNRQGMLGVRFESEQDASRVRRMLVEHRDNCSR